MITVGHVLSMKFRLPTEDINILWYYALGAHLVNEFTSVHSSDNLDVHCELSITGPSFHLGELGELSDILEAANSVTLIIIVC